MSPDPKSPDDHHQPQPPRNENAPPNVSIQYTNNSNQYVENSQLSSSLPTMIMYPNFLPDTPFDQQLECQFARLDISSSSNNNHQSLYGQNMVNGGVGSVIGNNNSSFDCVDNSASLLPQFTNEELQRMRVQSAVDGQMRAYLHHQQQGFFEASEYMRFLATRTSNYVSLAHQRQDPRLALSPCPGAQMPTHYQCSYSTTKSQNMPRGFSTNNGLQNPYEYFGVVPRNIGCTHHPSQYNNGYNPRSTINGENPNRYFLPPGVAHDMVQGHQPVSFTDLECLRGHIVLVAKDQFGCRFLQMRLEERKPEEIEMIYREVRAHVHELMIDQFANFLMQKLFEVCNSQQMDQLLVILVNSDPFHNQLLRICVDTHGTRAMQKFLEFLDTEEQRICLVSKLQHITLDLCKNSNGYHVIHHCLKFFTVRQNKQILDVVVSHCIDIATDKSGCCVLQPCVEHAQGRHRELLVDDITKNSLLLSENRYGNYVVQYLLGLGIRRITNDILAHLKNNFVSLSMNKFGSNVVEKCLKETDGVQRDQIILEIITHNKFLMVLQDSYGNYVVQLALDISQGLIRDQMIREMQNHYSSLHSHPHGKRVLARARGSVNKQRPRA